jgi:saccharopine dehydrogenase-like NADP-dependent oxidoreductase
MTRPEPIIAVVGVGVTGTRVATNLASADGLRIAVVDRRPDAAASTARSIDGAAVDLDHAQFADVVVLALPAPHATLARRFLSNGVAVVSMSDDVDDVRDLLGLADLAVDNGVPLVIGAAMAPGLSGLLARLLADQLDTVDEIHIAMHGTGGPSCARQHHRALGGTSIGLHDGEWIMRPGGAGRELCWFPEPVNAYDCYRAEMPDPILLHRVFAGVERMTARMSATRRDRFTSRLPMLRPPHREGGVGGVRVEVRGGLATGERETLIAGTSVRSGIAAAAVATAMARWATTDPGLAGAVVLGDPRLPTTELLEAIAASGVPLSEFTGRARAADG